MVAIVTIMSVGGAFAMNAPKSQTLQTWGVVATNANTYQVAAITANSFCDDSQPTKICEVQSAATPDPITHLIPKTGPQPATPVADGAFNQ